jgi:hypothetical protein
MGETPDELIRSIAETRERMTEAVRAIKGRAIRRYADNDSSTPIRRVARAVDGALDRLPVEAIAGDPDTATQTDASQEAKPSERDGNRSEKRKASMIVVLACAAAGVFAGLTTSPDGSPRSPTGS